MELSPCRTWANRGKRAAKLEMRGHYLPLHPPCIGGLESPSSIRSRALVVRHTNPPFTCLAGNFGDGAEHWGFK